MSNIFKPKNSQPDDSTALDTKGESEFCQGLNGDYEFDGSLVWNKNGPPIRFLDVYPKLPANIPPDWPHIIDLKSVSENSNFNLIRVTHMVITGLYNYNEKVLDAFLDTEGKDVKFCRRGPPDHHCNDIFVERKGSLLKCGWIAYEAYEFRIEESGKWKALSVTP